MLSAALYIAMISVFSCWHGERAAAAQSVELAQGLPTAASEIRIPVRDKDGNIISTEPAPTSKETAPKQVPAKRATQTNKPAKAKSPKPAKQSTTAKKPAPKKKKPAHAKKSAQLTASRICKASRTRPGEIWVENLADRARPAGPATFGVAFRRGLVVDTVTAVGLPSQIDVKRRWADGSLKHAVMTVTVPEIPVEGRLKVKFRPASDNPGSKNELTWKRLANQLPPVAVRLRIHKGPTIQSTLQRAKPQGAAQIWLQGEHVVEHLRRDDPKDDTGKGDPDIEVRYHVRHYPKAGATRVAVIVENTKWTAPGNVPYDVDIRIAGKPVFEQKNAGAWPKRKKKKKKKKFIGHAKGARWIKRLWIGRDLSDFHIRYPIACLVETGLLPRYDPSTTITDRALSRLQKAWNNSNRNILQNGLITSYFPKTGGRSEIGPLPTWTAQFILSQDPGAWLVTKRNGDMSASVNIHIRDPKTDRLLSLDDYPEYSLNKRGTGMEAPVRDSTPTPWLLKAKSHFSPDTAHQGSFAYVPYLLTGDYFYFEEMAFWANYNMLKKHFRLRDKGAGLLHNDQIRGVAWALRNLAHAAALAPDNSSAQTYFEQRLSNNLKHFNQHARSADRSPIGVYRTTHAHTRGWPKELRSKYYSVAPWQQNFLIWSVSHVIDLGYPSVKPFMEYLAQFPIGLLTSPEQISPHIGSEYFLFVAKKVNQKRVWAKSLKEVDFLSYDAPSPKKRIRPNKTATRDYSMILRGALAEAVRAGIPNARTAFQWLADQQGKKPAALYSRNPTWALSPAPYPELAFD